MSRVMRARAKKVATAARKPPLHAVLREEIATVVDIKERLYGIVDGLKRLNNDALLVVSGWDSPGQFHPEQREEYLKRVLQDAVAKEALSLGALAERLERLAPAQKPRGRRTAKRKAA
jgi:hypothetical protein